MSTEDYEIIFVDGYSSDGTDNIIKKYLKNSSHVRLYYENVGTMGHARNIGIQNSRGKIIAFTDGDAFPEKEWVKKISKAFSSNNDLTILGGLDRLFVDKSRDTIDSWRRLKKSSGIKAIAKIKTVNFAIRRDILLGCGGFDPTLDHFDEGELMARVHSKIKDAKILYEPGLIVYHDQEIFSLRTRIKKKFVKSSIGVQVLLRKHVLKAALADIGSPLGTSLGFIFAWIFGPLLFFSLLFLFNNVFVVLTVFLFLFFGIIITYVVTVKLVTKQFVPGLLLLLILDFLPMLAGSFVGLLKWLVNLFNIRN